MTLPTPNRYSYSPINARRDYSWPEGARLAMYIAVNIEHFSYEHDDAGEPGVLAWGLHDYGNRVGVWRLLDLLDELSLPAAALVNTSIYDYAPEVPAAFRERGDEIVGHGATNSQRLGVLDADAERSLLTEVTDSLTVHEGIRPQGWLSPFLSESDRTLDLLAELGYRYVLDWRMDDQPVALRTDHGDILAVPYARELVDKIAVEMRHVSAADYAEMITDTFDEMLLQAEGGPLVGCISVHPYVIGQPHRLHHLRRALSYLTSSQGPVWWTTPGAIAQHITENELVEAAVSP